MLFAGDLNMDALWLAGSRALDMVEGLDRNPTGFKKKAPPKKEEPEKKATGKYFFQLIPAWSFSSGRSLGMRLFNDVGTIGIEGLQPSMMVLDGESSATLLNQFSLAIKFGYEDALFKLLHAGISLEAGTRAMTPSTLKVASGFESTDDKEVTGASIENQPIVDAELIAYLELRGKLIGGIFGGLGIRVEKIDGEGELYTSDPEARVDLNVLDGAQVCMDVVVGGRIGVVAYKGKDAELDLYLAYKASIPVLEKTALDKEGDIDTTNGQTFRYELEGNSEFPVEHQAEVQLEIRW